MARKEKRCLLTMAHDSLDRYRTFKEAGWDAKVSIVIRASRPRPGVKYSSGGVRRARALPEAVKAVLRKEFPEYA